MITLITGAPGAGKTSLLIDLLLNDLRIQKRKIYQHGLRGLKIPAETMYCDDKLCEVCPTQKSKNYIKVSDWVNDTLVADGSIIIIDECQYAFRANASSKAVPDFIAKLETHRHRGIDFYLITQHPKLIHTNVRAMVSRHIHITQTWARRVMYEYPECSMTLSKTDAISSTYKQNKQAFQYYDSAVMHTKINRKIPAAAYFLIAALLIVPLGIYSFTKNKQTQLQSQPTAAAPAAVVGGDAKLAVSEYTLNELIELARQKKKPDPERLPVNCRWGVGVVCRIPKNAVDAFPAAVCDAKKCLAYLV
jgi:zona occludens toxin